MNVFVPFRGSFIQIGGVDIIADAEDSFRPLPGILYSNEIDGAMNAPEIVSVPFRGSFIQMCQDDVQASR